MQSVMNPGRVLREELIESLLISYVYSPADATFEIVCDFWNKPPGSDRAFLRLVFAGVQRFRRELGDRGALQGFATCYSARSAPGATVIQSVRMGPGLERGHVDFGFGPSFGGVSFAYESVVGHVRSARVAARGADYEYFDFETGAPFDFYSPFDS